MNTNTYFQQAANGIADYLYQELKLYPRRNYRIVRTLDGPKIITLALEVNPTYARKIMAMSEQLSMAAKLEKGYSIRIDRGSQGLLVLEVPKPETLCFNVSINSLPRRLGIVATMGIDTDHRPALVDFSDPATAHMLIAGATGSGKSNAARLLTYDLALQNQPEELGLILIDTVKEAIGWQEFTNLPHLLHPIITKEDQALKALSWTLAEIKRRAKARVNKPRLFIGIEEALGLLENEKFVNPLVTLVSTGRELGVHAALLGQDPTAKNLGNATIKRNLTVRLVGKVDSSDASKVATGLAGIKAETLLGKGDMFLIRPGDTRRIQAALVTEKDTARLPRVETVRELDLDYFEDIDQTVEAVRSIGRPADSIEPMHVARAMIKPDISQRQLNKEFGIGFNKTKDVIEFAKGILAALDKLDYQIVQRNTCNEIQNCNEIQA